MNITTYLIIGIIVAALIDLGIYYTKSSKQFTLLEICSCTLFWPVMIIIAIYQIIKETFK
jgi:hypothetical protein